MADTHSLQITSRSDGPEGCPHALELNGSPIAWARDDAILHFAIWFLAFDERRSMSGSRETIGLIADFLQSIHTAPISTLKVPKTKPIEADRDAGSTLLEIESRLRGIGYLIQTQSCNEAPLSPEDQEHVNYGIGSSLWALADSLGDIRNILDVASVNRSPT